MSKTLKIGGASVAALAIAYGLLSQWVFWSSYDAVTLPLRDPVSLSGQQLCIEVRDLAKTGGSPVRVELLAPANPPGFQISAHFDDRRFELSTGAETHLTASASQAHFAGGAADFADSRRALAELAGALPGHGWLKRFGVTAVLLPHLTGVAMVDGRRCCRVAWSGGHAWVELRNRWPREIRSGHWQVTLSRQACTASGAVSAPSQIESERVEAAEIDRSLAAVLRVVALQLKPVPREPDALRREGAGSLEIKQGWRVLRLRGKAYDLGFQHGRLLAPNIKRLCERVVYGVGFYYSLEKGHWFPVEAGKLVERQRPFIAPEYFEEMRGLADGAGLPLALVQAANIFPEFFHCSGAAVSGKATQDGKLLHARVLDYMTEVGLQDEAVLMAMEREGAQRFVNVSYAGFIGSSR